MIKANTTDARRVRRRREERELDALPSRSEPTKGTVATKVVGTYDQIEVVRAAVLAVADFGTPEHRAAAWFLVHLLATATEDDDWFVAVPAKVIQKHLRHLDWRALVEAGLVGVKPYSRVRRRCREFRVSDALRRAFYEAGPTAERVMEDGLYDLVSENPTRSRTKSQRRTASGNALPRLVRAAIDSVGEVPIDVLAIERHLDRLRRRMDEAEGTDAFAAAQGRYFNDWRCFSSVLTQGARPLDPDDPGGLWVYRPAYRPQRFGRVSQIGGGLQSCSTEMKSLVYPARFPTSL